MPLLTSSVLLPTVVGAVVVACGGAYGPRVVARLPEPVLESDREGKTPYAELGGPGLAGRLAVAGALVGAAVGLGAGWSSVLPLWLVLGVVGLWLAYVDLRTRLLPTTLIAPAYAASVVLLLVAALVDGSTSGLVGAALGWLVMGGFYLVSWLVYPRGIGYGDVRLSGVLGLALGYLGWAELVTGLYAAFVCGMVVGLGSLALRRDRTYPFGPCMLVGALAGLVWGGALAGWYGSV